MRAIINDLLINALFFFGFPASTFETADPVAVLVLFIFSTHIMAFFLAILIWVFVYSKHQHYKGGSDFGGLVRSSTEFKVHSYGSNDIFKSDKKKCKKNGSSSFLFGFFIPFALLFIALYVIIWIVRDILHF